jgi:hypothetical protein
LTSTTLFAGLFADWGYAGMDEAKKWVTDEFQPSTLSEGVRPCHDVTSRSML